MQKNAPSCGVASLKRKTVFEVSKAKLDEIRDKAFSQVNEEIKKSSNNIDIISTLSVFKTPIRADYYDGIVPYPKELVWSNHKNFKKEIENVLEFSIATTPSKFVACVYGDWGIGKSHAMQYFSDPKNLKILADRVGVPPPLSLPIIFPISDVFDSIYLDIIEKIGLERIKEIVRTIFVGNTSLKSETAPVRILQEIIQDERLAKVLTKVNRNSEAVERYILLSAKASDLRILDVARPIMTGSDKLKVLAGLFNLATYKAFSRMMLWIDDSERVEVMSGKDMFEFQVFIRDLLEHVPQKLNIITNFTLKSGEKMEDMIRYFGDPIYYRINRVIRAEPLTEKDFLEYVRGLLEAYREPQTKMPKYFPFEEPALRTVFKEMQSRGAIIVPRTVNNVLSQILEIAFSSGRAKTIKKGFIEKDENRKKIFEVLLTIKQT
jgi:hypothetical protein